MEELTKEQFRQEMLRDAYEEQEEAKLEWYENPENFPALITNTYMFITVNSKEEWLAEDGITWRLATKAELMSLYVGDNDD